MKSVRVHVTGLVQGVWYRQNTFEQARALGITGWVRNVDDGSVEILATGDEGKLEQLIEWCRKGPPKAIVSSVKITEMPLENFSSFEIRR